MADNVCLINGVSYSFTDIKLTVAGQELFSVSNVVAKVTQEKTNNYGSGSKPVSRGKGKKEFETSLELSLKDVQKLQVLSPTGLLIDLPMSSAIVLLDNGTDKTRIVMTFFEFNDDGLEAAADDTEMRRTYGGICADIIITKL